VNLELVFRFTHRGGAIENMNINTKKKTYIAHLHKSLYDEFELQTCLIQSGFFNFKIFKYSFPGEDGYKINLGFYASKKQKEEINIENECIEYLRKFNKEKILIDTIEFIK